ncbi:SGNH/GDSL hydrolase family protein [Streptomyces meridianus]|uniref:SGNH/GDSL hydrolase family protein n=1 Tax=Streptomyces meridianus TaxID=2938945 RepID=A0ABT0WZZ2_9ACTN|nr:SGNH/GDSL hydrolase family protein [Streptomyces meridianus]MCM2575843.1 SGNH/GDSL hydrolase family protein [Streptomyces meridianus]
MAERPASLSGKNSALLAALATAVVLGSTGIYVGFSGSDDTLAAASNKTRHSASAASAGNWVGTWSTSPAGPEPLTERGYPGMSIRNVVHASIGGSSVRVRLSNLFGREPLTIDHASIALASAPNLPTAAENSLRRLTFSGNTSVTIPAGQSVSSDPARLDVPAAADLLVTTYAPSPSGPVTYHPHARQTSYMAHGDKTQDPNGTAYRQQSPFWRYVTGVDVLTDEANGSVVVLGDSITDGITSTAGANRRFPDYLADRLRTEQGAPRYGVLNEGISGNRVLADGGLGVPPGNPSALNRFERDALGRTGVKAIVIELGVNDILRAPHRTDPTEITDGLRKLVRRAHAHGLRVVGGTLMPFHGHRGYTARLNWVREQVNAEIRSGRVFDDVVDFDRALRDPANPRRLLAKYDSGDHLHPSDAGYQAMARALNLSHLKGSAPAAL